MSKNFMGFDPEKCWDYENGFYLTSHINRLLKVLAKYELYKSIVGLPGHIVECGVYKGLRLFALQLSERFLKVPNHER